jgi:hypothetical protein
MADGAKEANGNATAGDVARRGEADTGARAGTNSVVAPDNITFDKEMDGRSSDSAPASPAPPAQPQQGEALERKETPADKMSKGRIALIMSALCVSNPFFQCNLRLNLANLYIRWPSF